MILFRTKKVGFGLFTCLRPPRLIFKQFVLKVDYPTPFKVVWLRNFRHFPFRLSPAADSTKSWSAHYSQNRCFIYDDPLNTNRLQTCTNMSSDKPLSLHNPMTLAGLISEEISRSNSIKIIIRITLFGYPSML